MKKYHIKKGFVIGIIFLFVSIACGPSINFNVIKASSDNDFVKVTSEVCGIKGFGNNTVKLTKQQYHDLEQYLVDFRVRLNKTTTKEEAIPLFNEAVVELNKYGLLPKGMSVEEVQKLVRGWSQNPKIEKITDTIERKYPTGFDDNENHLCLVAGTFTNSCCLNAIQTVGLGTINKKMNEIINVTLRIIDVIIKIYQWIDVHPFVEKILTALVFFLSETTIGNIILNLVQYSSTFFTYGIFIFILLRLIFANITPLLLLKTIGLGYVVIDFIYGTHYHYFPANGFLISFNSQGTKKWNNSFYGNIPINLKISLLESGCFPGIFGFTGISILPNKSSRFVLGSALWVKIGNSPPG